ncbi:MAG: HAD family acid phosphatase [Alphaproteobacteria bacterium]
MPPYGGRNTAAAVPPEAENRAGRARYGSRSIIPKLLRCVAAAAFVFYAGLSPSRAQSAAPLPPPASVPDAQPPNVGEAKTAATAYHDSGAYARDLAAAASAAAEWTVRRASETSHPALVLDIDETALTNWDVIKADDFGYITDGPCVALPEGPCGWTAWDLLAKAPAIGPTLTLFRRARGLNVSVFFITGRRESQRAATERNLQNAGYQGYAALYMRPEGSRYASAADFKAPVRAAIEAAGYTIVANMGDQPSDLAGGHAERAFLLPNPFYRIP